MGRDARSRPDRLSIKLLQIRKSLGLTQDDLVNYLDIDVRSSKISEYESGRREPDTVILMKYAKAAGIWIDWLVDDELDLPDTLPANYRKGFNERMKTTITFILNLKSNDDSDNKKAIKAIEKNQLKNYKMKKVNDETYDLTFSHSDEGNLSEQIYALRHLIISEAAIYGCSVNPQPYNQITGKYY